MPDPNQHIPDWTEDDITNKYLDRDIEQPEEYPEELEDREINIG